jgi:cation diffusion facilitator CzcD-associated flavoprotein CzcO
VHPGFAGVALKAFMTEDSSKPPGKVAVIGTTRTGDALVLDLQSQGGAVYWFDHERGEFLPLEHHLGTFLTKCVPDER